MKISHILIDDSNPLHRELPICRSGQINTVRLSDSDYRTYAALVISAHDMAALFHYGVIEAFDELPFASETKKGLDSWDEAFLPSGQLAALRRIVGKCLADLEGKVPERVLLGWHEVPEESGLLTDGEPQGIAYWREIDPEQARLFLERLRTFAEQATGTGYDLEFIL